MQISATNSRNDISWLYTNALMKAENKKATSRRANNLAQWAQSNNATLQNLIAKHKSTIKGLEGKLKQLKITQNQ